MALSDPTATLALAASIEEENKALIAKLTAAGRLDAQALQLAAVQVRLETLLDTVELTPLARAEFEVTYEQAIAALLAAA